MATVHVGPGQTYSRITDGANAAGDGGTVIVHQDTYYEQVVVRGNNITVIANTGDTPIVTGNLPFSNRTNPLSGILPGGEWRPWVSVGGDGAGASFKWTTLVYLIGDGIVWDGINSFEGAGRAIQIGDGKRNPDNSYYLYNNVEIKNTELAYHRGSGLVMFHTQNTKLTNVEFHHCCNFYLGDETSHGSNHPGCINLVGAFDPIVDGCNFYYNGGETLCFDSNQFGSTGLKLRNSTLSDGKEVVLYLHGAHDIDIDNCIFYVSDDRDDWHGVDGIGFRGINSACLELQSYNFTNGNPIFCGIQDVTITNSLFVNTGANFHFGAPAVPCISYHRNYRIEGCTFIQNKAKLQLGVNSGVEEMTNIVFEGNLFYVTDPSYALSGPWASGVTFKNNLWNHNPGSRFLQGSNDVVGDPILKNPGAFISRNAIDPANYKVETGSPAINKWAAPVTIDYFGNTRTVPSDFGFHDLAATGDGGGEILPNAIFTLSAAEVFVDVEVIATDYSTPSSGETITELAWHIDLPGTDINIIGSGPTITITPNIPGIYIYSLTVTQSNGGVSTVSHSLNVTDDVIILPPDDPDPDDPPSPTCNLGTWHAAVNGGSPAFSIVDDVYIIENELGDQGMYLSYWDTVVTPSDELTLSAEIFADLVVDAHATVFALFYNSSNQLLGTVFSINVSPNTDFELIELAAIAPANSVRLRMDIRAWNGAGTLSFRNPCVIEDSSPPGEPPTAVLEVSANGQTLPNNGNVDLDDTVDFAGNNSLNTEAWEFQLYKQVTRDRKGGYIAYKDPIYIAGIQILMGDPGAYYMQLTVTSSEGIKDLALHYFTVLDPELDIEVGFFVDEVRTDGIAQTGTVIGNAPLTVRFTAYSDSPELQVIGHTWELLDSEGAVIDNLSSLEEPIQLTFPYLTEGWTEPVTIQYGMRLTTTFEGFISRGYVQYLVVEVSVTPIDQIGPSPPATISPITTNAIKSDGTHEHDVEVTKVGEPNKFPVPDDLGVLFAHFLAAGFQDGVLGSWHNSYSSSMEKGIKFNTAAYLTAPELLLDAVSIIFTKLPRVDPNVSGAAWIDSNNNLAISVGTDYGASPPDTSEFITTVSTSANDAQEAANGDMQLTNGTIRLNNQYEYFGLRFPNVTIPKGAIIYSASCRLYLADSSIVDADVTVEDADNAVVFSTTNSDMTDRTKTSPVVQLRDGSRANGFYSFDLSVSDIEAVIGRDGWASGNALVLFFQYMASSAINFQAYDYAPANAAQITIEYSG